MSADCVVCANNTAESGHTLATITKAFHSVLLALEVRAKKEKEDADKLEILALKLQEATAKAGQIAEEKSRAEKRSDLYKERFLNAQKAIQVLHEQNLRLSNSEKLQKTKTESVSRLLFKAPSQKISPASKKLILAPDTCVPVGNFPCQEESTVISSDDEDFQDVSRMSRVKSPRRLVKTATVKNSLPKHSLDDTYFVKPSSPIFFSKRNRRERTESLRSMDETRIDTLNLMDMTSVLSVAELEQPNEDFIAKPPSPILSAEKRSSFQMRARGSNGTTVSQNAVRCELIEDNCEENSHQRVEVQQIRPVEKNSDDEVEEIVHSEQLHSIRKIDVGNTSLDELFDKTYGELETTKMLTENAFDEAKDIEDLDGETDDELDSLLLQVMDNSGEDVHSSAAGINEQRGTSEHFKPRLDNSFDVLPSKESNHKPNDVVRKKDEREKLNAQACGQCEAYYRDLPEAKRKRILQKSCRHKHVASPPSTPEHFWEVGIPSTAECRRRGYITDVAAETAEQKQSSQKWRRKRPLLSYSSKKN